MMSLYVTKDELFGVPRGRVERFSLHKAAVLMAEGKLEPFDPENKKHAALKTAQDNVATERWVEQQGKLEAEFKARGLKK